MIYEVEVHNQEAKEKIHLWHQTHGGARANDYRNPIQWSRTTWSLQLGAWTFFYKRHDRCIPHVDSYRAKKNSYFLPVITPSLLFFL